MDQNNLQNSTKFVLILQFGKNWTPTRIFIPVSRLNN